MSFLTTNRNPDEVKDFGSGGNWINQSGMYDLIINAAIVSKSPNGSTSIDLFVNYNGQDQMIYNAFMISNNDGSDNTIGLDAWNKFKIVTNMPDNLTAPQEAILPIGKAGADKEVQILPDFCDVEVTALIKMEYSTYNGKIQERKLVRTCFEASSKASASEIVNDAQVLKQFEKESEKANIRILKDGLTDEDIEAWISSGRGQDKTETKKPSSGFSRKTSGFGKNRM